MGDHKDDGINIDPAYVRALAELLDVTGLTEIEVEDDDRKIRVARTVQAASVAVAAPAPVAAVEMPQDERPARPPRQRRGSRETRQAPPQGQVPASAGAP